MYLSWIGLNSDIKCKTLWGKKALNIFFPFQPTK